MSAANRSAPFSWTVRVYYEDTDAGGIVYYANYLKFFERCRTEWLRAAGGEQGALLAAASVQFVVVRATIDYHRPARLDDLLRVDLEPVRIGRASFDFRQAAYRGDELLAGLAIRVACVDARSLSPRALPEALISALARPVST